MILRTILQAAKSSFLKLPFLVLLSLPIRAVPKVITPIRPIYINTIIVALPIEDSSGVIPVLRPTMPIADDASNRILERGNGSQYDSTTQPMNIIRPYTIMLVSAVSTR